MGEEGIAEADVAIFNAEGHVWLPLPGQSLQPPRHLALRRSRTWRVDVRTEGVHSVGAGEGGGRQQLHRAPVLHELSLVAKSVVLLEVDWA